jgi:hypothetical protein
MSQKEYSSDSKRRNCFPSKQAATVSSNFTGEVLAPICRELKINLLRTCVNNFQFDPNAIQKLWCSDFGAEQGQIRRSNF